MCACPSLSSVQSPLLGPSPLCINRPSYAESYWMKEARISRSGLLELRNSSVLKSVQRYLRMKYAASTQELRHWPRTECTSTLSVFCRASSTKLKISSVTRSLASNRICGKNLRECKLTHLVILVKPKEREVSHANRLPVVGYLCSCAVDHMSDFVRDHELEVLTKRCERFAKGVRRRQARRQ